MKKHLNKIIAIILICLLAAIPFIGHGMIENVAAAETTVSSNMIWLDKNATQDILISEDKKTLDIYNNNERKGVNEFVAYPNTSALAGQYTVQWGGDEYIPAGALNITLDNGNKGSFVTTYHETVVGNFKVTNNGSSISVININELEPRGSYDLLFNLDSAYTKGKDIEHYTVSSIVTINNVTDDDMIYYNSHNNVKVQSIVGNAKVGNGSWSTGDNGEHILYLESLNDDTFSIKYTYDVKFLDNSEDYNKEWTYIPSKEHIEIKKKNSDELKDYSEIEVVYSKSLIENLDWDDNGNAIIELPCEGVFNIEGKYSGKTSSVSAIPSITLTVNKGAKEVPPPPVEEEYNYEGDLVNIEKWMTNDAVISDGIVKASPYYYRHDRYEHEIGANLYYVTNGNLKQAKIRTRLQGFVNGYDLSENGTKPYTVILADDLFYISYQDDNGEIQYYKLQDEDYYIQLEDSTFKTNNRSVNYNCLGIYNPKKPYKEYATTAIELFTNSGDFNNYLSSNENADIGYKYYYKETTDGEWLEAENSGSLYKKPIKAFKEEITGTGFARIGDVVDNLYVYINFDSSNIKPLIDKMVSDEENTLKLYNVFGLKCLNDEGNQVLQSTTAEPRQAFKMAIDDIDTVVREFEEESEDYHNFVNSSDTYEWYRTSDYATFKLSYPKLQMATISGEEKFVSSLYKSGQSKRNRGDYGQDYGPWFENGKNLVCYDITDYSTYGTDDTAKDYWSEADNTTSSDVFLEDLFEEFSFERIFYDLLPEGFELDESSLTVYGFPGLRDNSSANNGYENAEIPDNIKDNALNTENYTYEIIKNFERGRDLLIVRINDSKEAFIERSPEVIGGSWRVGYGVYYYGYYTQDSIASISKRAENAVIVNRVGKEQIETPVEEIDTLFTNVYPNYFKKANEKDGYTSLAFHEEVYPEVSSSESGFTKKIRANGQKYSTNDITEKNNLYSYKLKFKNSENNTAKNIIIYDVLENAHGENEYWQGELFGIDISDLKASGIEPVIWYNDADVRFLKIEDSLYGFDLPDYFDRLMYYADAGWTTEKPEKVTAIAIDFTKAKNGNDFILAKGESIELTIWMKAPDENMPGKAYNNAHIGMSVKSPNTDWSPYELMRGNTVTVEMKEDYTALGSTTISGKKNLTGKAMETFSFTLKEGNTTIAETTNDSNGNFSFNIDYTLDDLGEHTYTITENNDNKGGIAYDSHTETITVNVTDNGDGTLKAEPVYDTDGVVFNNTYSANGTATISGKKNLTDKAMDTFTFTLKEGDEVKGETTNDNEGNFSFAEIAYTLADVGTHTYTITEKNDNKGGIEYDTHTETVTVEVTDNGDGTLKTEVKTDNDGIVFNNKYSSSGTLQLIGTKNLEGKDMEEFEFILSENGTELQKKTNDDQGKITFDTINFTNKDTGTHTYTITETNTNKPGIQYDTHTETVTVEVTDNGDGTITATPTYDNDGIIFNNTYSASGSAQISSTKNLTGRDIKDGEFEFDLKKNGELIETVRNIGNKITFSMLQFVLNDIGVHTYSIIEKAGNLGGIEYDEHTETVTIDVSDNGDGTLKTDVKYDNDGAVFNNNYSATGKASFEGTKTLSGRTLKDGEFEFELREGEDLIETVVNKDGKITFADIDYTLSDIGTHTYTISEKAGNVPSVEYDTHTETVTVEVTDNGDGTLKADVKTDDDGIAFNNVYTATGSTSFEGTKTLTGRTLKDDEFEFELKEGNNIIETVTNKDGKITFSEINYDLSDIGTHTYTISEKRGNLGGVDYDSHTETITVDVSDNGDGMLKTDIKTDADGIAFNNTYNAQGQTAFTGKKILNNKAMEKFSFVLKEGDTEIATVKNETNGNFTFPAIAYDINDLGEHTYTITEINDEKAGVTYDEHTEKVTVNVTDNGDGTLSTKVTEDTDGIIFENTYNADGSATISGKKNLTGKALNNGEFSFSLKDESGKEIATANTETGEFSFSPITFTISDLGTHTYTVTEINEGNGGVTYDTHTETVTIDVTDNGDGTLKAQVNTDDDGVVFNNNYVATGTALIEGTKKLTGRELKDDEFEFELKENDTLIETVSNKDGKIAFSEINYDLSDIGTHTYTISEKKGDVPGVDYDTHAETVTVKVTDNGDGTLNTEITTDEDGVGFTNIYTATGTASIPGKKTLINKKMETFSFTLKEGDEVKAEATNDEEGNFSFNGIPYTLEDVGTHTYTITETNDNKPGITYDEHIETVTVNVTDNGDGTLNAEVITDEDGVAFVNTYNASGTFTITGTKKLEGKDLEEFTFILTDKNGKTYEAKSDASGIFTFETLNFTLDDVGKEFTYTIKEKNDNRENIVYDEHEEKVTLTVTDNGDGTVTVNPILDEDGIVFVNKYVEPEVPTEPTEPSVEEPTIETITEEPATIPEEQPKTTGNVETGDSSPLPYILLTIFALSGIAVTGIAMKKRSKR